MEYNLKEACSVLERTPAVLKTLLSGLDDKWIMSNEGESTFSPFDVVGHLLHGEKTDWPDRIKMILEHGVDKTFVPYDRFAMYEESKGKTLDQLLNELEKLRGINLKWFRSIELSEDDLAKKGIHPKFGEVTLKQLVATWVVHDLTHIAQVSRVMARQYKAEIGPWVEFFRILNY